MSLSDSALRAVTGSRSDAGAPHTTSTRFDARTRLLLEGPIVSTLLRLATPNVLVMFVQASVGLIETYFVAKLGTDALAGVALVFPMLTPMQMMWTGAMGGGISSAIARALGAGRRADADALVLHALAIAVSFGLAFMLTVLGGGRWLHGALGGRGASLAATLTSSQVVFSGALLIWLFNALANVIRGSGNMAVPAAVTSVHIGDRLRIGTEDHAQWQMLIANDLVWELPYALAIGHAARLSGREEVVGHVAWFLGAVEQFRFFDLQVYAFTDPEAAVAEVKAEARIKPTARLYRQKYVLFLRAAGGKIAFLREYFDPVRAAQALDTPMLGPES
jgi:ketosteroid isomerase-like protein